MPFESGKFPVQIAAFRAGLKRLRELRGWYHGYEESCVPPKRHVTACAIPWWLWHTCWSCGARGHICGAGHERTLRHDSHGCPSLHWSELSQEVLAMDSDSWGAFDLFMRLCTLILDSDVHASFECLLGSSWFAIVHKVIAYLKEQMPIAAFTIAKDAQI